MARRQDPEQRHLVGCKNLLASRPLRLVGLEVGLQFIHYHGSSRGPLRETLQMTRDLL